MEARTLFEESKKEPSKLYESRVDFEPSHLVHYAGDSMTYGQLRTKIPGDRVRELLQEKEAVAAGVAEVKQEEAKKEGPKEGK